MKAKHLLLVFSIFILFFIGTEKSYAFKANPQYLTIVEKLLGNDSIARQSHVDDLASFSVTIGNIHGNFVVVRLLPINDWGIVLDQVILNLTETEWETTATFNLEVGTWVVAEVINKRGAVLYSTDYMIGGGTPGITLDYLQIDGGAD